MLLDSLADFLVLGHIHDSEECLYKHSNEDSTDKCGQKVLGFKFPQHAVAIFSIHFLQNFFPSF